MRRTRARKTVVYLSIQHTPTRYTGYYTNSVAILNVCLMCGMPVDYAPYGSTLLEMAIYKLCEPLIELLIRYNANVNIRRGYPLSLLRI